MLKQKITKIALLLGVALTLTTPVVAALPVFMGKASAQIAPTDPSSSTPAPSSTAGTVANAEVWALDIAAESCLRNLIPGGYVGGSRYSSGATNVITSSDAASGKWSYQLDGGHHVGWWTSYLAENTNDSNDKADCNKVISAAVQKMGSGFDATTILCGLGFTRTTSGDGVPCEQGVGDFQAPAQASQTDWFAKAWDNYVLNHYFGAPSAGDTYADYANAYAEPGVLTDAMRYYVYYNNFNLACGDGSGKPGSGITDNGVWDDSKDRVNSNTYKLDWINGGTYETDAILTKVPNTQKIDGSTFDGGSILSNANLSGSAKPACKTVANLMNTYGNSYNTTVAAEVAAGIVQPDGGGPADSTTVQCNGFSWNPLKDFASIIDLNWILCPLIHGLMAFGTTMEDQISAMLCVNETQIFGSRYASTCGGDVKAGASDGYHQAWNVFRLFALGLLALAGLVMILSQGLGFEFVDSYTIKRTLPRIIVAAVGITLSWQLLEFAVYVSNVLGIGIRHAIYAPFDSAHVNTIVLGGGSQAMLGLFGWGTTLIGGTSLLLIGPMGILSLLAGAVLAVAIAFFTLVLRNILVIMLIIMAPIGIVAYILPNTEKYWKLWWDWFSRALLAFPIITAMIAIGHVFAAITSENGTGGSGAFSAIIALIAYFAPYFLIPAAFKMAGGALATLSGMANDRSRGVFDRMRNYRAEQKKKNLPRAQAGKLYGSSNAAARAASKFAMYGSDPGGMLAYHAGQAGVPGFKGFAQNIGAHVEHQTNKQTGELFKTLNEMGYNDKAYRMLSGAYGDFATDSAVGKALINKGFAKEVEDGDGGTRLQAIKTPTTFNDFTELGNILNSDVDDEGKVKAGSAIGAEALKGSAGFLANTYRDPELMRANVTGAGAMGLAAHGFASAQDLADSANFLTSKDGGSELEEAHAQSIISQAQLMGTRGRPDVKNGYGVILEGGKFISGTKKGGKRAKELIGSLQSGDLAGAKAGAFKDLAPTMKEMYDAGGHERDVIKDRLFSWAGPYSQASQDVNILSRKMIQDLGPDVWKEFEAYSQRSKDPTTRNEGGQNDPGADGSTQPPLPGMG